MSNIFRRFRLWGEKLHRMDLLKMIGELEAERNRLDQAIIALERLSAGKVRRRGRPPGWLKGEIERAVQEDAAAQMRGGRSPKASGE